MTDSTPRLPDSFAGSISEGTLNTRHLVPRYCEVISYVWPTHPTVERYKVLGAALDIIFPSETLSTTAGRFPAFKLGG